jgi:hypothetical protein
VSKTFKFLFIFFSSNSSIDPFPKGEKQKLDFLRFIDNLFFVVFGSESPLKRLVRSLLVVVSGSIILEFFSIKLSLEENLENEGQCFKAFLDKFWRVREIEYLFKKKNLIYVEFNKKSLHNFIKRFHRFFRKI